MDDEIELLLQLLLLLQIHATTLYTLWRMEYSKRWLNRRWRVHPINSLRSTESFFITYFAQVKLDPIRFFKYTRMSVEAFYFLCEQVSPYLTKKNNTDICAEERLIITLRYLATGDSIGTLSAEFRIGDSTCQNIIKETCEVIHHVLSPIYVKLPSETEWKEIAAGFLHNWNLPNCCGAMDGKHVSIVAPKNSNSVYFNYKKFFSTVLLAVCNHKYEFLLFDVGAVGSESDGGIFMRSELGKAVQEKRLNFPREKNKLPGSNIEVPYYLIGDDAFQMTPNFMKPFPGRFLEEKKAIFNYRLSRGRRVVESSFGILSARWRFLFTPSASHPSVVNKCVLASICLHNYLMKTKNRQEYCPSEYIEKEEVKKVQSWTSLQNLHFNDDVQNADEVRNTLADYFMTHAGAVPWQLDYIRRGTFEDMP